MLILSRLEVEVLLDRDRLVDELAGAMAELSRGTASVPPRVAAMVRDRGGLLAAMPAFLPSSGTLETKLVSLFPANAEIGLPTHQAVIVVFDAASGTPTALMDATYITEARTAAGSALATRLLARPEASVLAVLGTGAQARAHTWAVPRVRSIREVRVAARDPGKARDLAAQLSEEGTATAATIHGVESFAEAVDGADVVCACTHAAEPVVRREWLRAGVHVNSVGVSPSGREVDAETVRDAVVVVESRRAVLAPFPAGSNDIQWPIRDGVITEDHLHAEIGEVTSGTRPGRTSPDQITLYKSVGVGVQDAAAAALVLEAAGQRGGGTRVDI